MILVPNPIVVLQIGIIVDVNKALRSREEAFFVCVPKSFSSKASKL